MAKKPNFGDGLRRKNNVSTVLQAAAPSTQRNDPLIVRQVNERPSAEVDREMREKKAVKSQRKKLSNAKVLLEYEEKREIELFMRELGDRIGHRIQFSVFTRALLLTIMANRDMLFRVAEDFAGLERPSNSDVEAFRAYEGQIRAMIFDALRLKGRATDRN